jgi:glycosyltransferase involved in cell wall biosynthesis
MRIVGTNHGGYANDRNITGLPLKRYRVVRARNLYRGANFLHFKLRGRMHAYLPFLHWDGGLANYDLLHFFNGISLGTKPWLSTFETFLPRWGAYGGKRISWGLEKLMSPACKRLIALSQCTRAIQAQFLEDYPAFAEAIMAKVAVLQPAQATLLSLAECEAKWESGTQRELIQCLFVGADFFRKGGLETLRAIGELLDRGAPLALTIVSAMHHGDYASQATAQDLAEAMQVIARHPQRIRLHRSLPNAAVLDLARQADLGLLPTWADTYGYAALEFMAAGCPVLSTDIRALPEINAADRGWLIHCEKDAWGNAVLHSPAQRHAFSQALQRGILDRLTTILNDRRSIAQKGRAAFAHIDTHHSPIRTAAILENWYDQALK